MSSILVVDDDRHILRTLQMLLEEEGHVVFAAGSAEEALPILAAETVDVALVDLQLPGMSGTELLRRMRDEAPHTEAVIITAHGSIENAVETMKEGAFDYLTKPFTPQQVRHRIEQIERVKRLEHEVAGLRQQVAREEGPDAFQTRNARTRRLVELVVQVAPSDVTVLITGESGTGKNRLARLLHRSSLRKEGPFVAVDCSKFQESLLESELFGHRRGAFTGAVADQPGKVESAAGGTLFLDEVGEIPLHLQGKLLRFVDERLFERLGESAERTVDARIVAATNRDLEKMVERGEFRKDLFFRLSVVDLAIPALRHRPEDVLPLVRHFIGVYNERHGRRVVDWERDVETLLLRYPWPGNVRELMNAMERAVLLAPGRTLRRAHLPERICETVGEAAPESPDIEPLALVEERAIRRALARGLSLEETAERLGIAPATLWRKRRKLGL